MTTPAMVTMIDVAGRSVSGEKYAAMKTKVRTGIVSSKRTAEEGEKRAD
jgi:hypothetical protein